LGDLGNEFSAGLHWSFGLSGSRLTASGANGSDNGWRELYLARRACAEFLGMMNPFLALPGVHQASSGTIIKRRTTL